MADPKDRMKSMSGKRQDDMRPAESPAPEPIPPVTLPATPSEPPRISDSGEWESQQSALQKQQEEAQGQIVHMEQELSGLRKSFQDELRKKEEDRIKLLAQITLSDRNMQGVLHRYREDFEQVQSETREEIESLEKRLQDENVLWSNMVREIEKKQEEFVSVADFRQQEQELERRKREQELEKILEQFRGHTEAISGQIEAEQRQWRDRIQSLEKDSVALASQLQLKESNRRLQEQKLQQELTQSQSEWEFHIRALETRLEQERQKWQEELALKETEFQTIKMESEKSESALQRALKNREEEMLGACSRAEGKLKVLQEEFKKQKSNNEELIGARQGEVDKLRAELVLLESQLKVDAEKAEANVLALQKDAAGKISFLEKKMRESVHAGQKAIENKRADIQAIEMQFAIRRRSLEEEFSRKKEDIESQRKEMQKKLGEIGQVLEKEREQHRLELIKQDEAINTLKTEMSRRTEDLKKQREQVAGDIEARKQAMAKHLSEIEEQHKQEKQALLEAFAEESRILSDKKAALSQEEEGLLQALKKQEDQLLFEVQPIKNQILDIQNRLEQERASRSKVLGAKEEVLKHLDRQKVAQEENLAQEISRFEAKIQEEDRKNQESMTNAIQKWHQEKIQHEQTIANLRQESKNLENEIASLSENMEEKKAKLFKDHQRVKEESLARYEELAGQMQQEAEQFKSTLADYDRKEKELQDSLKQLLGDFKQTRHDNEQKFFSQKSEWKQKIEAIVRDIEADRASIQKELDVRRSEMETLQGSLSTQRAEHEKALLDLEAQWNAERQKLESETAALNEKYETRKLEWHRSILERTGLIEELERKIVEEKKRHEEMMAEMGRSRQTADSEFQGTMQRLQESRAEMKAEAARKFQEKSEESARLEKSLEDFISQSKDALSTRRVEIAQKRNELESRRSSLHRDLNLDEQRWPELISQKDMEIEFLKKDLDQREVLFKAEWEKAEKDFEQHKREMTEKIDELQKQILSEHQSVEEKRALLQLRIEELHEKKKKEEERSASVSAQMEEEFSRTKSVLDSEIGELEKKIVQERGHSKQQIKLKDLELSSLKKNIEQKELQRNAAREVREKEITQERARLQDWENSLAQRMSREKEGAENILRAKSQELESLAEKVKAEKEKFQEKQAARQQEVMESKTVLEIRVKELTRRLEEESEVSESEVRERTKEIEQLSAKLLQWNEIIKLEEEQERVRWEEEQKALTEKIREWEQALVDGKSGLDRSLRESSEEISRLNEQMKNLQQVHEEQMSDLQRQKNEILVEEEKWERKLREEKARVQEEMRVLERETERLKVELSLKETQLSIDKQKKEREARWARRALETKLADLKRRWEEDEKEKKRKQALQAVERDRIVSELARLDEVVKKQAEEKEAVLLDLKGKLALRMQDMKGQVEIDLEPVFSSLKQKRQEAELLKESCQKLGDLARDSGQDALQAELEGMRSEIASWEERLAAAVQEEKGRLEKDKENVRNLQKELNERKREFEKGKMRTADYMMTARIENEKIQRIGGGSAQDRSEERAVRARNLAESGVAAFSQGDDAVAVSYFNRALKLDPNAAVCYQMLGLIHDKQGDKKQAAEYFKKLIELDPQNETAQEYLKKL